MRKHELVFVHSLLVVVRKWLAEREEVPEDAFDAYDESGVSAAAIDRRKGAHEEAIWLLLAGLRQAMDEPGHAEDTSPVPADD